MKGWVKPEKIYVQRHDTRLCYIIKEYKNDAGIRMCKVCYVRKVFRQYYKCLSEPFEVKKENLLEIGLIL